MKTIIEITKIILTHCGYVVIAPFAVGWIVYMALSGQLMDGY